MDDGKYSVMMVMMMGEGGEGRGREKGKRESVFYEEEERKEKEKVYSTFYYANLPSSALPNDHRELGGSRP